MNVKALIPVIIILIVVLVAGAGFLLWYQRYEKPPPQPQPATGAIGTAKEASEAIPEIETNVGEKVPEVNPLDRVNPFKYENPLR